MNTTPENTTYDVALSFAGEDRQYVAAVAEQLRDSGVRVFYDAYEQVSLWGKDLYVHLQEIYEYRARFTVMFVSEHYARKLWTSHERKSAQARAFKESGEYILPVRFDQTEVPGLLPTVGYLDARAITPDGLATIIARKVREAREEPEQPGSVQIPQPNFRHEQSVEQAIVYFDIGEAVDENGRDITKDVRPAIREVLSRYKAIAPKYEVLLRPDLKIAARDAHAALTEIMIVAGVRADGITRLRKARVGISLGQVERLGRRVGGEAVLRARHAAIDPIMDHHDVKHGVFLDANLAQSLDEKATAELNITKWGTGLGTYIYKLRRDDGAKRPLEFHFVNSLPEGESFFVVCASMLRATTKRAAAEQDLQSSYESAVSRLGRIVGSCNHYIGAYPAGECLLAFPGAREALLAAEHIWWATRDTDSWNDTIIPNVQVSIAPGRPIATTNDLGGEASELARLLAGKEALDSGIALADKLSDGLEPRVAARCIAAPPLTGGIGYTMYYPATARGQVEQTTMPANRQDLDSESVELGEVSAVITEVNRLLQEGLRIQSLADDELPNLTMAWMHECRFFLDASNERLNLPWNGVFTNTVWPRDPETTSFLDEVDSKEARRTLGRAFSYLRAKIFSLERLKR